MQRVARPRSNTEAQEELASIIKSLTSEDFKKDIDTFTEQYNSSFKGDGQHCIEMASQLDSISGTLTILPQNLSNTQERERTRALKTISALVEFFNCREKELRELQLEHARAGRQFPPGGLGILPGLTWKLGRIHDLISGQAIRYSPRSENWGIS